MKNYEKEILNKLLDKYERSKSFTETNAVRQNFSLDPSDLSKKYADDADYETFTEINRAILSLENLGLVNCQQEKGGVVRRISLNCGALDQCYDYACRMSKKAINARLTELFTAYRDKNEILSAYCGEQLQHIAENKSVKYSDDPETLENILKALSKIFDVSSETFQRDFSVRVFGDSKVFEKIRERLISILYEYGDFPDKETILEDLNIVRNPGHVYFKGAGVLTIAGQRLDIRTLRGDIALSSSLLSSVDRMEVCGNLVMTIENLTTFHAFSEPNVFAIYLGGYHNADRRKFIKKIYEQNRDKKFLHYGDIDAGGFYILRHLRQKTGVAFEPFRMDANTLQAYSEYAKPLTENDRKRLEKLRDGEFGDTAAYMLEHNCKLEQEALDI